MSFKYSVIGDNTIENREHLEKLGYSQNYIYNEYGVLYTSKDTECFYLGLIDNIKYDFIDCIGNPQLFKAVSAMRDDSDYMQWYKTDFENKLIPDVKEMYLCKSREFRGITVKYKGEDFVIGSAGFHKATKDEIIKRFTNDENMQ